VTTLAGRVAGFANGIGANASFREPHAVALDSNGNVFVADCDNHRIRNVTPGGVVGTLAGGAAGYADGTGTGAKFNCPRGMAVASGGNV
jgi:serine/threonine-protein kinase